MNTVTQYYLNLKCKRKFDLNQCSFKLKPYTVSQQILIYSNEENVNVISNIYSFYLVKQSDIEIISRYTSKTGKDSTG